MYNVLDKRLSRWKLVWGGYSGYYVILNIIFNNILSIDSFYGKKGYFLVA